MTPTEKLAAFKTQAQAIKEGVAVEFVNLIGLGNNIPAPTDWNFSLNWRTVKVDESGKVLVLFRFEYDYKSLATVPIDTAIEILGDVVAVKAQSAC